jgi:hypothetical protein
MGSVVVLRKEVAPQRQTPQRRPNGELRVREHLTEREVERLIEATKGNRHRHRDATMIPARLQAWATCAGTGRLALGSEVVRCRAAL